MSPVTDPTTLRLISACATEMHLRRIPRAVHTTTLRSPAICGLFRPTLLLPTTHTLSQSDLRLVLLHELAHVRRHDVAAEWLTGLLTSLHWFNPLVWLAASASRSDRELACDAAVLRTLADDSTRADYGPCLLRVVEAVGGLRPHPAAVNVFARKRTLHRRIHMISTYRPTRPPLWTVTGLLTFTLIAGLAAAGPERDATNAPAADSTKATAEAPELRFANRAEPKPLPKSDEDAATQTHLDKRLPEVRFDAIPLSDAIDFLRDATGANIFVNWRALEAAGIEKKAPVSIRVTGVRFSKALDIILRDVGNDTVKLGFTTDDGVITISTDEDLHRNTVTRVYDARDILTEIPDFDPDRPKAPNLDPLTAGTLNVTSPADAASAAVKEAADNYQARVRNLTTLIQETISPESWRDAGGTVGSIRELSGQLIVTQIPETQDQIAQLLETLRESRALQITIEARYLFLDQKTLDDAHLDLSNSATLSPEKVATLLRAAQTAGSTTLTAPRLTMFNGQRARIAVGSETPYVADYTVHTKDGDTKYEPRLATAFAGTELELQATTSADRKTVTTTIRTKTTTLNKLTSHPYLPAIPTPSAANLNVDKPDLTSHTTQTTLTIPNAQTALIIPMSAAPTPTTSPTPKGQTLLLLKPTILLQGELNTKTFPLISKPAK